MKKMYLGSSMSVFNNRSIILLAALALSALAPAAFSQNRPTIVDVSAVKETQRTPKTINRQVKSSTAASRPTLEVLIVQTDPEDAQIKINGKVAKARDGEFRIELVIGRPYPVEVSAGPDYEPLKKVVTLKRKEPQIIKASLTSHFGLVRIGPALEGAKVFVDDQEVPAGKIQVDKESNQIIIDDLPVGKHKITFDHPKYVKVLKEFTIAAGREYTWTFNPELPYGELSVVTNPGTKVYVDNEYMGETPGDGKLKRSDIRIGEREIKLKQDGYEEYVERKPFELRKTVEIKASLVPLPTSAGFSDDFDVVSTNKWTMPPSGWSVVSGRLNIANSPIGYPTGIRYRNFEMSFHLKLNNAGGATWALRAKDSNNYYLFYLSGPQGFAPGRFLTYVVLDGKLDTKQPVNSEPVITKLEAGGQYQIMISATGNKIEHKISSAATGKETNLGFFEDAKYYFPYGNIGFRTVGSESFSIDELYVHPR
jgi:PEGA domain-containing protein